MARITCKMQSLGNENYDCPGCDKKFRRSEQMNAVVWDDGDPAGWFCDDCVSNWDIVVAKSQNEERD